MLRSRTALFGLALTLCLAFEVWPAVPNLLHYQGRLTETSGDPVADGNYSITFTVYDAESGGNVIWTETQGNVAIAGGNFSTLLGSVAALGDTVFAGATRFLQVQVGAEVLLPRSRLASAGYAHRISSVDGAKAGKLSGTLEVQAASNPGTALKVSEAFGQPAFEVATDASGNAVAEMDGNLTIRAVAGGGTALTVAESGGSPALEVTVDNTGVASAEIAGSLTLHAEEGGSTPLRVIKSGGGNASFEITLDAVGNATATILNPVDEKLGPGAAPTKMIQLSQEGIVVFGATEADTNASILPNGSINTKGTMTIGDTTAATDLLVVGDKPHTAQFHNFNDGNPAVGVYASVHSTVSPYPAAFEGNAQPTDSTGIGGYFMANYIGVQSYGAGGATGQKIGVHGLGIGGASAIGVRGFSGGARPTNTGVQGTANGGTTNYGILGITFVTGPGYWAGYFDGDVNVTGTLSKGAGAFRIDHPLDPARKYLQHSFVESPDMMNVYNGMVKLDARGEATVELPAYFEALNRDFRYQLTAVGAPGPNLYVADEIRGNRFRIAGGGPHAKVSWQVTGVRGDVYAEAHRIEVELDKSPSERNRYIYPELLGQPEESGLDYEKRKSAREVPVEPILRENTDESADE